MGLSFICKNCGKKHRNISTDLAGRKVKCKCGKVQRLQVAKPVEVDVVEAVLEPEEDEYEAVPVLQQSPSPFVDVTETWDDPFLSPQGQPDPIAEPAYPADFVDKPIPAYRGRMDDRPVTVRMLVCVFLGAGAGILATGYGAIMTIGSSAAFDLFNFGGQFGARSGMGQTAAGWGTRAFTILFLAFGIAMTVAGVGQFVVSFLQLVKRRMVSYWPDGLSGMCSVGILVAIAVGWFLAVQSLNNSLEAQRQALDNSRAAVASFGNQQSNDYHKRMEASLAQAEKTVRDARWSITKQLMLFCTVPVFVLAVSVFRMIQRPEQLVAS